MSLVSIIIPTYNRCGTLQKAIFAYLGQTALQNIAEIVVVDDGSTDATGDVVAKLSERSPIQIRYFRQENKGPAAARNLGISQVRCDLVLFTDDDIIPASSLVAEHLAAHRSFPDERVAILGNVSWAQELKPTPFMKWYGSDALFAYGRFVGRTELDYTDFYTCNLSLKTAFLRRHGVFDEDFKFAAYEDIELGFRLKKVGMRLVYNPEATAYHQQYVSFEDACRRARKTGMAEEIFRRKEAGMHFASRQRLNRSRLARPLMSLKERSHGLRRLLAVTLAPFKSVMDWKVPLPGSVYRTMLRIYR